MRASPHTRRALIGAMRTIVRDAGKGNSWPAENLVDTILDMIDLERNGLVERFEARSRHVIWNTKTTVVSGWQGYVVDRLLDQNVYTCDHKHQAPDLARVCVMPRASRLQRDSMR